MANICQRLRYLVVGTAIILAGLLVSPSFADTKIIPADEAFTLLINKKLILIDIRSPKEWAESGIPKGAKAITMHKPGGKTAFLRAVQDAVAGNSDQPIALICAVGGRSKWARRFLADNGFTNVADVSEGMFGRGSGKPGWIKRGLPVEPCPIAEDNTAPRCGLR